MASETFVQPTIPRFDGHYDHWSMLMENFLRSKEYWHLVETRISEPEGEAVLNKTQKSKLDELRLKDLKVKNYLFQAIDRSILDTILCKDTSKKIWDSMKKKYQGTTKVKRAHLQALRRDFEILHMQLGEYVSDYFSRTMGIANKCARLHGDKMEDVTIVEKILRSMIPKFKYVVCSIEESKDIDTLSIDELMSSLMVHEQRINQHVEVEQALQAQLTINDQSSKKKGKGQGNKYEKSEGKGQSKGRDQESKPFDKSRIKCF